MEKLILDNGVTVVDFWASWCGPCKVMLPVVNKVCVDQAIKTGLGLNSTVNKVSDAEAIYLCAQAAWVCKQVIIPFINNSKPPSDS